MGYQLIETIEVGSGGASSIEFTGIPQTGVNLVVTSSARGSGVSTSWKINFNSDTSANYSYRLLTGTGSSVSSVAGNYPSLDSKIETTVLTTSSATADTFSSIQAYVSNYTSTASKSVSTDGTQENNATASRIAIGAGSYLGTSPITSIQITSFSASYLFVEHSTFSLYMITAD
tara:strand:+ start:421 stop:942 length:522 start_codon:yes stop_codon:yes gene_type:complete